jgi:asparagine N-glycosylation enzyme membrane subunit Stt3
VALLVAAVATVWVLVLTFPLVLHLSSGFYGRPGDASGTIAVYWWWSYALQHGLNLFDNSMLGGPLGSGWQNLAFTVLDVAIMAPLSLLLGPVLAYNLQNLVSFPLTAAITYLLAREAGASRLGSAFAGLALAFIPYHLEKAMGHVTQTHLELFAGSLLLLLRWRRTRQWRYVVLSGLLLGITMWWDPYYVVILSFLIAAFSWFRPHLLPPGGPASPAGWAPPGS